MELTERQLRRMTKALERWRRGRLRPWDYRTLELIRGFNAYWRLDLTSEERRRFEHWLAIRYTKKALRQCRRGHGLEPQERFGEDTSADILRWTILGTVAWRVQPEEVGSTRDEVFEYIWQLEVQETRTRIALDFVEWPFLVRLGDEAIDRLSTDPSFAMLYFLPAALNELRSETTGEEGTPLTAEDVLLAIARRLSR